MALLYLSSRCLVTVNVPWFFLRVPWIGLQCVIIELPDHTRLLFTVWIEFRSGLFGEAERTNQDGGAVNTRYVGVSFFYLFY